MSKSVKVLFALSLVAVVAACGQKKQEVVYVEPVTPEPTYNKY